MNKDFEQKIKNFFTDKKNIAIIILSFLLFCMILGSSPDTSKTQYENQIKNLNVQIEKLNQNIDEKDKEISNLKESNKSLQEQISQNAKTSSIKNENIQNSSKTDDILENYILNTSSKKFHYSNCSSISNIKESNKSSFTGTRDEIIEKGYSPCGTCKP